MGIMIGIRVGVGFGYGGLDYLSPGLSKGICDDCYPQEEKDKAAKEGNQAEIDNRQRRVVFFTLQSTCHRLEMPVKRHGLDYAEKGPPNVVKVDRRIDDVCAYKILSTVSLQPQRH